MLTIEIVENESVGADHLCLNGQILDDSYAYVSSEDDRLTVTIYSPDQSLLLGKYTLRDLAPHVQEAILHLGERPGPELRTRVEIHLDRALQNCTARLLFLIDAEQWAGPFSLAAYRSAVQDAVRATDIPGLSVLDREDIDSVLWMLNGFGFSVRIHDPDTPLHDEVTQWIRKVEPLLEHTRAVLSEEVQRDTLVTLFNFPPASRTACEQYLLYFIQFLRDLGIEAEGDIRHRTGQVLFSVKPEAGSEALDRIRQALAVYLQIPSTPEADTAFGESREVAVLQLQANVHHLKGQLALASAVSQARDAQVEALQMSNYQYRQIIAAAEELNQIVSLPAKDQQKDRDEEPLLKGIITVTQYEGKGFKVNLPALLRNLKRRVSGSEDRD